MSSKRKVLILLPVFDLGGAEKQGFYIAKSLQTSGMYDVEVWALDQGSGNLCALLETNQLRYSNLSIPFSSFYNRRKRLKIYLQFRNKLRKSRINAIIPFTYHCNVLAVSTYKFAGVQKCLWFQIAMEFHIPLSFFEKLALKFNPIYAANSIAAGSFISEKHRIELEKVAFIPNPFESVDWKQDRTFWRNQLGVSSEETMLFIAANFFPEKDHETLIQGFYEAVQANKQLKLVLAGSQNYVERINAVKALCFQLGLTKEQVVFIGSSDDVPGLINASDICLLTSISEGSPNALIEYMGYGKPIIASNIPSIAELLKSDYPFLFEPKNALDLARKMLDLTTILSTDLVEGWVAKNQARILTEYTIETNFNAFQKLLAE
jgi:glycosyltransferase involved in cell wall biosynthesis